MSVITRGMREISQRLEDFPPFLQEKLTERIGVLTEQLWEGVESVVPHRTGKLAGEIASRLYSQPQRIAGYVSVYAPGRPNEYPKAGALEYGWWAAPHPTSGVMSRLLGNNRRAKARTAGATHVAAARYLRGPLAAMKPEAVAALDEAVAEAIAEKDLA